MWRLDEGQSGGCVPPTLLHAVCILCARRFVFVVDGEVQVKHGGKALKLAANDYVYFPPGSSDT